ncbi:HNH endonuclease [Streptomyces echinoruber]|uniref:HNH endonuclease n=1 Tax=Streptomyces echinoruber TaxID=68898 RepID=A0A918RRE5_9ACTN|nr:HNH endonuclease [Streptomyces echinoruber]GHA10219.1 HNH endonuclease [Streptomyces echinoruber]
MIRLARIPLPRRTVEYLERYGAQVAAAADPKAAANTLWSRNTTVRTKVHPQVKQTLGRMAAGRERCMYCGDSQGCAIDHFEPLAVNPLRAFDWANHLLACTVCNSHYKRDEFPCDEEDGSPLLLDPTCEEPLDHLHLHLGAGVYAPLSPRGEASIRVFGLNRPVLIKGRIDAYTRAQLFLGQWNSAWRQGDRNTASRIVDLAWNQPLADVLASMFHQAAHPAATALFAGEEKLLTLLTAAETRNAFGTGPSATADTTAPMP